MTTFQALINAFLAAFTYFLPVSGLLPESLNQNVFHWTLPGRELHLLVALMGSIAFLIFFRFDWLGMLSALIKTIAQPLSLKPLSRNLDQHTLLFLALITLPYLILKSIFLPALIESEFLNQPFFISALLALFAFGFHFSLRWNKRIHGLNHLKLGDGFTIAFFTLFAVHPAIPYVGVLWIGFALTNYHYEAVFKYGSLAVGLNLFVEATSHLKQPGLRSAMEQIGYLNAFAVLVVIFTFFWMGLENLEKNLNDGTYKTFKWVSLASSVFFIALFFLRN